MTWYCPGRNTASCSNDGERVGYMLTLTRVQLEWNMFNTALVAGPPAAAGTRNVRCQQFAGVQPSGSSTT